MKWGCLIILVTIFMCNQNVLGYHNKNDNGIYNGNTQYSEPVENRYGYAPNSWLYPSDGHNSDVTKNEDPNRIHFPGTDNSNYPPYNWKPTIFTSTTSTTTTTESPYKASEHIQTCMAKCPLSSDYDPVCGTDNITYFNLGLLQCAMKCGVVVNVLRLAPCPGWLGSTTSPPVTVPSKNQLQSCMSMCPTTSEYNPVCGTDNVTYKNNGKLMCAQICGVVVSLKRQSPCPKRPRMIQETTLTPSFPTSAPLVTRSPYEQCMGSCLTTPEYNPVCGSNMKTYDNIGTLRCANYCGVDVTVKQMCPCPRGILSNLPRSVREASREDSMNAEATHNSNSILIPNTTPKLSAGVTIPQELLNKIFSDESKDDSSGNDSGNQNN